jgi:hypothetical protein
MPPSLSDQMLAGGCASHVEAVHGEPVTVLSGPDAGKTFTAVRETEADLIVTTDLSEDPRAKNVIRFRDGNVPRIIGQCVLKTSDGKKWHAVKAPQDGYLTTDFELREIVPGKDT